MSTNLSCGQALMQLVQGYGIDTVFGMPGVHTLEYYRAIAGTDMRHVLFRHEQGGGFMADGYARISGRPAGLLCDYRARGDQYRHGGRQRLRGLFPDAWSSPAPLPARIWAPAAAACTRLPINWQLSRR